MEFGLKALQTDNFRVLCQEYGISPKTGYKWRERMLRYGLAGWRSNRAGPGAMPMNWPKE